LDFSKYQNISKITFNVSESIVVSCFAEAFDGFPLKEVDFGSGNVAANARSFATKTTGTIEKVTVSPNTRLSGVDVSVHDSPFAGQTTISTIDVSSFTTIDDVTDAD